MIISIKSHVCISSQSTRNLTYKREPILLSFPPWKRLLVHRSGLAIYVSFRTVSSLNLTFHTWRKLSFPVTCLWTTYIYVQRLFFFSGTFDFWFSISSRILGSPSSLSFTHFFIRASPRLQRERTDPPDPGLVLGTGTTSAARTCHRSGLQMEPAPSPSGKVPAVLLGCGFYANILWFLMPALCGAIWANRTLRLPSPPASAVHQKQQKWYFVFSWEKKAADERKGRCLVMGWSKCCPCLFQRVEVIIYMDYLSFIRKAGAALAAWKSTTYTNIVSLLSFPLWALCQLLVWGDPLSFLPGHLSWEMSVPFYIKGNPSGASSLSETFPSLLDGVTEYTQCLNSWQMHQDKHQNRQPSLRIHWLYPLPQKRHLEPQQAGDLLPIRLKKNIVFKLGNVTGKLGALKLPKSTLPT